jgi:hypothetical protein
LQLKAKWHKLARGNVWGEQERAERAPVGEVENVVKDVAGQLVERSADLDKSACNPRHKRARSKITNHQDLLPGLDGRSSAARRFRDLVSAFVADMGGLDQCSEVKLGLLRRLAATTVCSELVEARLVNGGAPINVSELCALASTSLRLSSRLGLERVARDVSGPSLGDLLRADLDKNRRRRSGAGWRHRQHHE